MLLLRNLDETILTIASAEENSVGENLERHKTFLRDPTFLCTVPGKFGEDFFTAETVDEATRYLRKRFFLERSRLFQKEVILRDLPKQKGLNKLLASSWTFATSYIRDVLVKEMLIKNIVH